MTGITDERHLVEAGLAVCAALRTLTPAEGETAALISEAEAHFNAVRTPSKAKAEPGPKTPKPEKPVKPGKPVEPDGVEGQS
jgi:hypothetical protein